MWPALHDFPWVPTIQAIAAIWVAVIATRGLKTWRLQQQAERKAKFLDELLESVYSYLDGMTKPISVADYAKIGMQSHIPPGTDDVVAGAIAYIERAGQPDATKLFAFIKEIEPSKQRIESLVTKGQCTWLQGLHSVSEIDSPDGA